MNWSSLPLRAKLAFTIIPFVVAQIAFGVFLQQTISQIKVGGSAYNRIVLGKDLVADILPPPEYIIETYLVTLQMLGSPADQMEKNPLQKS